MLSYDIYLFFIIDLLLFIYYVVWGPVGLSMKSDGEPGLTQRDDQKPWPRRNKTLQSQFISKPKF
jgi:hypothetical protein